MRRRGVALLALLAASLVVWLLVLGSGDPQGMTGVGRDPDQAPGDASVLEARAPAPEQQGSPPLGLQGARPKPLAGHRSLEGRVLDARGVPAGGVQVVAFEDERGGARLAEARTAADGSFTLAGLPSRLLRIWAGAAGPSDDEAQAWVHPDAGVIGLRLAPRIPAIEVVVVDERGVLVPDFELTVSTEGGLRHVRGREGRARLALGSSWSIQQPPRAGDAFVVRVRDPRDATGRALDLVGAAVRQVTLPVEPMTFVLPDCPAWRGLLRAADGMPLAWRQVRFRPFLPAEVEKDVRGPSPIALTVTSSYQSDERGRIDAARPHRDAALEVIVDGDQKWLPERVTRGAGDDLGEIVVRAAVSVVVEVRGPSGEGVPLAEVHTTDEQPQHDDRQAEDTRWGRGLTGLDGRVELAGLDPDRTYRLTVSPRVRGNWGNMPPEAVERWVKANDLPPVRRSGWRPADTVVTLEAGGTVSGEVLDESGQPAAGAWVSARSGEGWTRERRADERGAFILHGLPEGPVTLRAAWTPRGLDLTPPTAEVRNASRAGQRLVLSRAGTARVRVAAEIELDVLRASGRQDGALYEYAGSAGWRRAKHLVLGNFEVGAIDVEVSPGEERHDESGESGLVEAMVEGLKPGQRYAFWVQLGSKGYLWAELAAGGGPVTIVPTPGQVLEVEVVGCRPDEEVNVELRDGLGRPLEGTPRLAKGRLRVEGVPAGEWHVRVHVDTPGPRSGAARVRTGIPGRVELLAPAR